MRVKKTKPQTQAFEFIQLMLSRIPA